MEHDASKEWRPLYSRLIVFTVPKRNKILGGLLYQPNSASGHYTKAQECWVISAGDGCRGHIADVKDGVAVFTPYQRGEKYWVGDGFEFIEENLDLWDRYKDDPAFSDLRTLVDQVEGEVRAQLVFEDALLAHQPRGTSGVEASDVNRDGAK